MSIYYGLTDPKALSAGQSVLRHPHHLALPLLMLGDHGHNVSEVGPCKYIIWQYTVCGHLTITPTQMYWTSLSKTI